MVRNHHKKEIEEYVLAGARKAATFGTPAMVPHSGKEKLDLVAAPGSEPQSCIRRFFASVVFGNTRFSSSAQEQIGADVQAFLDEHFPDWIDDSAEQTGREIGGW
jgi:hypothetical protein